jgi:hypothetical protein
MIRTVSIVRSAGAPRVVPETVLNIERVLQKFVAWLDAFGETSQDHQDFFAGTLGRKAKALYYRRPAAGVAAVAPMIFCEAFLPAARRLFWKRQRLPIADAHYAMGFAYLAQSRQDQRWYARARHFLEVLVQTRCAGYRHYCWGYPFHWQTRNGIIPSGTPLITTTPYVYEAFEAVYEIDRNPRWLEIMASIAEHAATDIKDFPTGPQAATCSYTPFDRGGVINASAYRGYLLTSAAIRFSREDWRSIARRNINFVLQNQRSDGAWIYAADQVRDFIDHFHTCFVLKALAKTDRLAPDAECTAVIDRGLRYYVDNLFDAQGRPKPFSKPPRLTMYRHELYDYAECLNLCVLLADRHPALNLVCMRVLKDLLGRWIKPDGSLRCRKLLCGWDNVPMHRWGLSQAFRSLSLLQVERHSSNEQKDGDYVRNLRPV